MAKVKQTKMQLGIDPDRPRLETVVYTNYDNGSRKDLRFYIKLPHVVADALCKTEVRAKSQEEVMELFKQAISQFKELKTETSKVILYEITLNPHPNSDRPGFTAVGLEIKVWAGTYQETVAISGVGTKRYSYERIESSLSYEGESLGLHGWTRREGKQFTRQVPLTEQNEAFFRWIQENMTKLIAALAEIESPSKLIEMVMAGRLLPLGVSSNAEAQP